MLLNEVTDLKALDLNKPDSSFVIKKCCAADYSDGPYIATVLRYCMDYTFYIC